MKIKNITFLKYVIFLISSIILISIDQIVKKLVTEKLSDGDILSFIGDKLEIMYFTNKGAAFGILQGKHILFIILTILVIILLLYMIYKMQLIKKYIYIYIFSILLFSGTIGNFIDRIRLGYVVDFIYVKIIDFPIFNIADSYITVACIIMAYAIIFKYKDKDFDFLKLK